MITRVTASLTLISMLVLQGCGGSDSTTDAKPRGPESAALRQQLGEATNVKLAEFPTSSGRTLRQVADSVDGVGPQLSFATQTLTPGARERLAFGVIDPRSGFVYAPTVLYVARSEGAKAAGPYPAPADLLVTDTAFRSQTAATDSDPFAAIYEARVAVKRPGRYLVLSVSKVRGQTIAATGSIRVTAAGRDPMPGVGERAPRVATDTVGSAGGNISSIDTRLPPDDMHTVDFKDVAGKKPVALLFATPALCQSRVCGPVVDIAAQLKATYGDRMVFIHQEVYVDNDANKGLRAPLKAFGLRTEPWLFVVNRQGEITSRLEGSFGFDAFESAIKTGLR